MKHVRNVSEMVDRVAHAICKSRTCEGISCCQWPANGGRTDCPVKNGGYDDAARDALAAARVPTAAMCDSSADAGNEHRAKAIWQDMLEEALRVPIDESLPKTDAA